MVRNIVILGSTGSVGKQALEVISWFPKAFRVVGLAANQNIKLLEQQVMSFNVPNVAVMDSDAARILKNHLGSKVTCISGMNGVLELVRLPEVDMVLVAVSGTVGLLPTLEAIKNGKTIALANKETLVSGGNIVVDAASKYGVQIIPVDSEHSAIFQCITKKEDVSKLIITGSGGPFRTYSKNELKNVTPEMALRHPTWRMGAKISIDSATLMNKGLEVIEAKWLFDLTYDQIEVVIHPQSIIHGLVVYKDGAVLAQLGWPDMRVPIQYALLYPERKENPLKPLDLVKVAYISFEQPDQDKFPCLYFAREAGRIGGTMPAVLNAANEVAVKAFLERKISFVEIANVISECMSRHVVKKTTSVDEILYADEWARNFAEQIINIKC